MLLSFCACKAAGSLLLPLKDKGPAEVVRLQSAPCLVITRAPRKLPQMCPLLSLRGCCKPAPRRCLLKAHPPLRNAGAMRLGREATFLPQEPGLSVWTTPSPKASSCRHSSGVWGGDAGGTRRQVISRVGLRVGGTQCCGCGAPFCLPFIPPPPLIFFAPATSFTCQGMAWEDAPTRYPPTCLHIAKRNHHL